jgi:hypothetical protein
VSIGNHDFFLQAQKSPQRKIAKMAPLSFGMYVCGPPSACFEEVGNDIGIWDTNQSNMTVQVSIGLDIHMEVINAPPEQKQK